MKGNDLKIIESKISVGAYSFLYVTPVIYIFERFVFNDWEYLISMLLIIGLDSLCGGVAALMNSEFSMYVFYKKIAKKLAVVGAVLICVGIIKNATISGEANPLSSIVDAGLYSIMLGFEAISVLKNLYRIYPWAPIKALIHNVKSVTNKKNGEDI